MGIRWDDEPRTPYRSPDPLPPWLMAVIGIIVGMAIMYLILTPGPAS